MSQTYDGNEYKKRKWKCHDGHTFEASPFTVLSDGHRCPDCLAPTPWKPGRIAKRPFLTQVRYDALTPDEANAYEYDAEGRATRREVEK